MAICCGVSCWNFGIALGPRRLTRVFGRDAARDMLIDSKRASRAMVLSPSAVRDLLATTDVDTRALDLATLV